VLDPSQPESCGKSGGGGAPMYTVVLTVV
jgi:hypothetical protein